MNKTETQHSDKAGKLSFENIDSQSSAETHTGTQGHFRNIFGPVHDPNDLYGVVATRSGMDQREILKKLALCCGNGFDWSWKDVTTPQSPPAGSNIQSNGDSDIPAGYTYLAQLVAHDMVQTTKGLDEIGAMAGAPRNHRVTPLALDTLYGGGPLVSPLAFEISYGRRSKNQQRVKLVASRAEQLALGYPDQESSFRDIGRIRCPMTDKNGSDGSAVPLISGTEGKKKSERKNVRRALIADPRNDDNLFLSQLLVVFGCLHSEVFDILGDLNVPQSGNTLDRYRMARQIVTLVYRDVVREDLLKRLLCNDVYSFYEARWAGGRQFLDKTLDMRIPVEFSHAVYRFGHAMIRKGYRINDRSPASNGRVSILGALELTSDGARKSALPLTEEWWIQWRHFFDFQGTMVNGETISDAPQKARRIGPGFVEGLDEADIVPHFEGGVLSDLLMQDVLRSAQSGARSVRSLYQQMPLALSQTDNGLSRFGEIKRLLKEWLQWRGKAIKGGLSPQQIDILVEDPPLAFFVLFEAAVETGGNSLGHLGSLIVAETMFQSLASSRAIFEDNPNLQDMCNRVFANAVRPADMASLIAFVDANRDIRFV